MAKDDDSTQTASDSSKKVAKAARAGATTSPSSGERRELGFPLALAAVVFAGIVLVVFARSTRDVSALTPTFGDHWHAAYGIYDCQTESFLPNLADPATPNSGIHTHGDGVMHIHPRSSDATGVNAKMERFLEAVRVSIDDDATMSFSDRDALTEEGAECNGEPAILQIVRFQAGVEVERFTEDLNDVRFLANQEAFTIALAPADAEIPTPPAQNVETAAADSGFITQTDGLDNLDLGGLDLENNPNIGLDPDGNLVDGAGNILTPAEELTELPEDADTDSDDG